MKISYLSLTFLLSAYAVAVFANDASSAISAGGLIPRKNTRVVMESERLRIEPARITVEYVFYNPSSQDETTIVAFPLPDLKASDTETLITPLRNTEAKAVDNFVDFIVEVDGKKVAFETEQKAWLGKKDVTAWLKKWKLPLIPYFPEPEPYLAAIRALTPPERKDIVAKGLVSPNSLETDKTDMGKGWEWDPIFFYTVKTQFYWKQVFPKKTRITIRHSYSPMPGNGIGPVSTAPQERKMMDDLGFCAGKSDFFTGPPQTEPGPCASRREISYILTTAKTWKGPIGDFRLELKGMRYLFTCFEGLKRTSDDTWSFSAKAYSPKTDLKIAFCGS